MTPFPHLFHFAQFSYPPDISININIRLENLVDYSYKRKYLKVKCKIYRYAKFTDFYGIPLKITVI